MREGTSNAILFFFSPGLRHARTAIVATGRVARTVSTTARSRRFFFVRRGLLPSFLFQRVPVIAVVVTLSFIFSFLTLLFSCENEDNGCVLSSAQVLFVLMFCVTHLVVFITSYFYSVGLPVVFTSLFFFFFGPCLILDLKSFNVCCFVCYRCVSE